MTLYKKRMAWWLGRMIPNKSTTYSTYGLSVFIAHFTPPTSLKVRLEAESIPHHFVSCTGSYALAVSAWTPLPPLSVPSSFVMHLPTPPPFSLHFSSHTRSRCRTAPRSCRSWMGSPPAVSGPCPCRRYSYCRCRPPTHTDVAAHALSYAGIRWY